ncbi:MAG: hypothetical protein ACU0GG_03825 [Paracoccaceae bacterium]
MKRQSKLSSDFRASVIDPPFESKNWGQSDWQSHVEKRIGPWIDAMLFVDFECPLRAKIETLEQAVAARSGIADQFRLFGMTVDGENTNEQWTWSVGPSFDCESYERLMNL